MIKTKQQKDLKDRGLYGIVQELTEGQYYMMKPHPTREGWAIEVAYHLKGPYDNPKSWKLSEGKGEGDGDKYMVLWSDVDTKFSNFIKRLLPKIKNINKIKNDN